MKLKGSVKTLTPAAVVCTAFIPGVVLIALRVVQTVKWIDPGSGFFTDGAGLTRPLFYILAPGLAVLTFIIAYLTPLSKAEYIAAAKRPLHALAALFLAAAVGLDAYLQFTSAERTRLTVASGAVGILAVAALVIVAVSFFTGKELIKKAKALYLAPALWAMTKTVAYFAIYTPYLKHSTLLLQIFADLFLMIFLYEYARKITGLGGDGNSPSFLASACVAAVLELAAVATPLTWLIQNTDGLYTSASPFALYRCAAALFCLTAAAVFLKNNVPDYDPAKVIPTHPLEAEDGAAPEETDAPAAAPAAEGPDTPEDDAGAGPADDAGDEEDLASDAAEDTDGDA